MAGGRSGCDKVCRTWECQLLDGGIALLEAKQHWMQFSWLKPCTNFSSRYIALKILIAGLPSRSINHHDLSKLDDYDAPTTTHSGNLDATIINEINILQRLSDPSSALSHSGSAHILSLVDHFIILGPNGTHRVLATEVTGPRLSSLQKPSAVVRDLCRQLVEGVDYMHQHGITHGGKRYLFQPTLSTYLHLR